ncbi:MAG: argininosuccinate lyase [Chloroflexi bacterium]|nr:argininosuccinate lyase [Chloroflexota bacterium]
MWGGRFTKGTDDAFARLNASFSFDWRLYDEDIRGSIAYAHALARAGIISAAERDTLAQGLERVKSEFASDSFQAKPGDEDIHTAVERRLGELVGPVAGKLHTGRSRNDQVATDARLYVIGAAGRVQADIRTLQRALVDKATEHLGLAMPGYTHLQRAQPLLFSHWLVSFFWMLQRDYGRFGETGDHASVLPLGAGALAGNAFQIDREFLSRALGFRDVAANSVDAVSDRDFIADFLFAASLLGVHLSRLSEDLILYSTAEFGFVAMDEAYATGSSLMPQKKNPDALELARGKVGRLVGHLTGFLTTMKGLPSSYDKDLQEDKEPLFDASETLAALLPVLAGLIRSLHVNGKRMHAALDATMLATDLADYLVRRGVPFREAHHKVGEAVKLAEARGVALEELTVEDYQKIAPEFGADVKEVFDFGRSIATHDAVGGTAPASVRAQIERAREVMAAV